MGGQFVKFLAKSCKGSQRDNDRVSSTEASRQAGSVCRVSRRHYDFELTNFSDKDAQMACRFLENKTPVPVMVYALHPAPSIELAGGGAHRRLPKLIKHSVAENLLIQTANTGFPSSKLPQKFALSSPFLPVSERKKCSKMSIMISFYPSSPICSPPIGNIMLSHLRNPPASRSHGKMKGRRLS